MGSLLDHPGWVVTLVIVGILVLIAIAFAFIAARWRIEDDPRQNEVAGAFAHLVGITYAVLLGFMVVVSWESYDRAVLDTQIESSALGDLYRTVSGFPSASRDRVRADIAAYVRLMYVAEWPAMQHGGESDRAQLRADRIVSEVDALRPKDFAEQNLQAESLTLAHAFLDARRRRLTKNQEGMPAMLWWTLWIGALVSIGFTFFMRVRSQGRQMAMAVGLAVIIGLLFSLVVEFEYPYRGEITVPVTAWEQLDRALTSGVYSR